MEKCHFHYIKSDTLQREVVDGSNESLYYPDEEWPLFENGVTFVIDFQKVVCEATSVRKAQRSG